MKNRNLWAKVASLFVFVLLALAWAGVGLAWDADRANVEHTGDHIFTEAGSVDLRGTLKIDGTEVTATAAQLNGVRTALEINGDLTLANDETIDNATDAKVSVTFDDDAAVLGELVLESDNAVANVADNDSVGVVFKAYDSATAKTEYASIDLEATDVTDGTEDGRLTLNFLSGGAAKAVNIGSTSAGVMAMTLPAGMEANVDGKFAIVGGDATTGLMVQKAAVTSGTGTTHTVTFAVAFGAAPIVTCTYTEDPGDVRPIWVSSVTTTNFVANITADKNFGYQAIGTRP
jgi:hypothetical protein